jgi:hypothetical protein
MKDRTTLEDGAELFVMLKGRLLVVPSRPRPQDLSIETDCTASGVDAAPLRHGHGQDIL